MPAVKPRRSFKSCSSRRAIRQTPPPGHPAARPAWLRPRRGSGITHAQEGIRGAFFRDHRRQCRRSCARAGPARAPGDPATPRSRVRPRAQSEGSTRCTRGRSRSGRVGQRRQLGERRHHLRRRAFEQPAAACRKQGVAAKDHALRRLARCGLPYARECPAPTAQGRCRARRSRRLLQARACDREWPRAPARNTGTGPRASKAANAADVIAVMMRRDNRRQRDALALEIGDHRRCVARIDDGRGVAFAHAARCSCRQTRGWG